MEAATTLPFSRIRTFNGEVLVDGLRVDDEAAVRLVQELEQRGEAPDKLVRRMIEVGARVLDREQTGHQADFVKAEFERQARQLDAEFVERARRVAERLDQKVDEVFGPEDGHVTKALARHFGDESAVAVQHKVRAVVTEVAAQMREDVRKQFTSDSADNPIVAIQRASLSVMKQNADQQGEHLRTMNERLEAMRVELTELRSEKQRLEEVAAIAEKGTAKGRTYEESVFEALDAVAIAQGDDCDAVGDVGGVGGRKGDVVVALDACSGPARGRIVFEAKNSKLSKKQALAELDEAMTTRDADFGVFVVPTIEKLPAKTHPLREFNGNKMFVVFDPEDGSRLELEVAYKLARARVLMSRGEAGSLDPDAVRAEVERALGAMEDVRRIKSQHTQAQTAISEATKFVDAMAAAVRNHLAQIDALLRAAEPDDDAVE
jgi:hypothetical protein